MALPCVTHDDMISTATMQCLLVRTWHSSGRLAVAMHVRESSRACCHTPINTVTCWLLFARNPRSCRPAALAAHHTATAHRSHQVSPRQRGHDGRDLLRHGHHTCHASRQVWGPRLREGALIVRPILACSPAGFCMPRSFCLPESLHDSVIYSHINRRQSTRTSLTMQRPRLPTID